MEGCRARSPQILEEEPEREGRVDGPVGVQRRQRREEEGHHVRSVLGLARRGAAHAVERLV